MYCDKNSMQHRLVLFSLDSIKISSTVSHNIFNNYSIASVAFACILSCLWSMSMVLTLCPYSVSTNILWSGTYRLQIKHCKFSDTVHSLWINVSWAAVMMHKMSSFNVVHHSECSDQNIYLVAVVHNALVRLNCQLCEPHLILSNGSENFVVKLCLSKHGKNSRFNHLLRECGFACSFQRWNKCFTVFYSSETVICLQISNL